MQYKLPDGKPFAILISIPSADTAKEVQKILKRHNVPLKYRTVPERFNSLKPDSQLVVGVEFDADGEHSSTTCASGIKEVPIFKWWETADIHMEAIPAASLTEFTNLLATTTDRNCPVQRINGHQVTVSRDGEHVTVGCTTVKYSEVEALHNFMHDRRTKGQDT